MKISPVTCYCQVQHSPWSVWHILCCLLSKLMVYLSCQWPIYVYLLYKCLVLAFTSGIHRNLLPVDAFLTIHTSCAGFSIIIIKQIYFYDISTLVRLVNNTSAYTNYYYIELCSSTHMNSFFHSYFCGIENFSDHDFMFILIRKFHKFYCRPRILCISYTRTNRVFPWNS